MTRPGVALTFDDGPDPSWTPRFLSELRRLSAPATFFVLGSRVAQQRRLVRRMIRAGHDLGLHGHQHLRHDLHPAAEIEADARRGLEAIALRAVRLWRPPHGIATTSTHEIAGRLGLELVGWTADTIDWQSERTPAEMLAGVRDRLEPGAVVLMHDAVGPGSHRASPGPTLALLAPLVEAIRARGLEPDRIATATTPAGDAT